MVYRFTEHKIVIASHNPGKVSEIKALLKPFNVDAVSASQMGLPEPIEDGDSFIANAEIKARATAKATNLPALADDSGLVVPSLGGDPGIYSARWGGPNKDFGLAMRTVWQRLEKRSPAAYFTCALSLCWPNTMDNPEHVENFEGHINGTLTWPPRGKRGFGYDPIFIPNGFKITFGEFDPDLKHAISHRAEAFNKLVETCFAQSPAAAKAAPMAEE